MVQCPLCDSPAESRSRFDSLDTWFSCQVCGRFKIGDTVTVSVDSDVLSKANRYVLSGLTRERHERGDVLSITLENLQSLLQSASVPEGPLEAMDRILQYIARKSQSADEYVPFVSAQDYPLLFAKHGQECFYLVMNLVRQNLLESPEDNVYSGTFRLTPAGWSRAAELRRTARDSNQAFVAMWFDPSLNQIWSDGFQAALSATEYRPIRIDQVSHNERIDDRIIAEIRRSGLVVADFTENRGGVYFEAGFAMGLGIPVIWTCREDFINKIHFDTRQYNHIVWTGAADLKEKLVNRIEATLPNRTRRTTA